GLQRLAGRLHEARCILWQVVVVALVLDPDMRSGLEAGRLVQRPGRDVHRRAVLETPKQLRSAQAAEAALGIRGRGVPPQMLLSLKLVVAGLAADIGAERAMSAPAHAAMADRHRPVIATIAVADRT